MVTKSHYLLRFLVTDPKIFPKAHLAPIYTNIEGGARAEKTQFFSKFFKKCLKSLLRMMAAAQKFWSKQTFQCFGRG